MESCYLRRIIISGIRMIAAEAEPSSSIDGQKIMVTFGKPLLP
jgi:hypothetical protein